MSERLRIEPVTAEQYELVLPMIAEYQRFYGVERIDEERNRAFFRRFLAPSDRGLLLAAWDEERPHGYACLYWHMSSLAVAETVLMNDLFVDAGSRGRGVGRALIEGAARVARERGAVLLEWSTAPDNATAQRLYDATGAVRSTWLSYELEV